jgi:hypothetical protein
MGEPGVTGLADAQQSWRLGMPVSAAASWIAAHRPARLKPLGYARASFSYTAGYDYQGPSGPAWGPAQLDVGVAPDGADSSVMRADGLVAWLDPVPFRDTAAGPRLRVLTAGHCAATDARVVGVRNPGAHLTRALLPAGQPVAALRCAYHGLNGSPFRLKSQQRLGPVGARALAAAIASPGEPPGRLRIRLPNGRRVGGARGVRLPGPRQRGRVGRGHRLRHHQQRLHLRERGAAVGQQRGPLSATAGTAHSSAGRGGSAGRSTLALRPTAVTAMTATAAAPVSRLTCSPSSSADQPRVRAG